MANNTRPRAPTFTSPKGVFSYPKLSEVDFGTREFPKPEGEYSVVLFLKADDETTQAFIAKLEPYHQQAIANGEAAFKALKVETRKKLGKISVNDLYTVKLDPTTEEPTGDLAFKFALRASGTYKSGRSEGKNWDTRPTVYGADQSVMIQGFRFETREAGLDVSDVHGKVKPNIGGGTIGKVAFELGLNKEGEPGYFIPGTGAVGLKLALNAVQVLDLVSAGARTAEDYGFDNETGGSDEETPPWSEPGDGTADF